MTKITATGYILAALLGAALFISNCGENPTQPSVTKVYDTITRHYYHPEIPKEDSIIYRDRTDTMKDTVFVLKDYFASRRYTRTHEDSNILITVKDTVSENKLGPWAISYKWKQPVTITHDYPKVKKSVVFVGAEAGTMGLGIGAGYMTKSGLIVDGAFYPGANGARIGVKWGIRF